MASFSSVSFSSGSFSTGGESPPVVVETTTTPSGVKRRRVIFDFEDDGRELVFESLMKRLEEAPVVVPKVRKLRVRDTGKTEFVPYEVPAEKPIYRKKSSVVEAKAIYGMILEGFQRKENIARLKKIRDAAEEMEDEEMMQFIQFMLTHD